MSFRFLRLASLSFLIPCVLLSACDDTRVFEENREFKQRSWVVSEEPVFEFNIGDSTMTYNLYYNIRNSLQYDWDRIFVTYALTDSSGAELSRRLVYNDLFDVTGRPLGESGIGDLYDHQFPMLKDYRFPHRGKFRVRLIQFSRQDTLRGVLAAGVRVERAE